MQKFFLMIFSVSLFFIGVGGVVRQFENYFLPSDVLFASFEDESPQKIRVETQIPTIKERHRVIFENKKIELPNGEFQIKVPVPPENPLEMEPNFELERSLSREPLKESVSLPRVSGDNLIIIKRGKAGEDLKTLIEERTLAPTVKVSTDEENQAK